MESLALSAGAMAGLGVLLAVMLAAANRLFHVEEDPRIDAVEALLPQNNCGACGNTGCRYFAEAVVRGEVQPGACPVSDGAMVSAIAEYLGVDAGAQDKRVARLACAGGRHVAWLRARYEGMASCRAANLIAGGGKGCAWGCLGLGDCAQVCLFGAIHLDADGLPHVDADRCTGCNACVEVCPRALYSLHPRRHRLWVACKNQAEEEKARAECEVACIACGRCAADAPEDLVYMKNNLAHVDYEKNAMASLAYIQRCPTGAIVWLDSRDEPVLGEEARRNRGVLPHTARIG